MKRRNYFSWMEDILEILADGHSYTKKTLAEKLELPGQASLSNGPGLKAIMNLVKSGKVLQEGRGYCLRKSEATLLPLSLQQLDIDLQNALDMFVKNVVRVVSDQYERERVRQAQALTAAEDRISELSHEVAALKFNKSMLPNVVRSIQNQQ